MIIKAADHRNHPVSPLVVDLNNDNQLDLVFYEYSAKSINVFLGNGNGSFREEVTLLTGYGRSLSSIAVGDFNNDSQLDLAFTAYFESQVGVLLGNDDGTIGTVMTFSTGYNGKPEGIAVVDFNGDSYLDIAVVNSFNNNVGLFLGHGDGNFEAQTTFSTGHKSESSSIAVADFDGDNHPDISIGNVHDMNVGIFRGHGDGTFEAQKSFYTGSDSFPVTIRIGDFNNDTRPDVIFSNNRLNIVGMMLGFGNGTLGVREKFVIGNASSASQIVVGDFNCDGHLDIVVGQSYPYSIAVMVGYGNGKFDIQVIFLVETEGDQISIAVGDYNGDNCQDIIAMNVGYSFIYVLLNTCECCTAGIVETTAFIHQ